MDAEQNLRNIYVLNIVTLLYRYELGKVIQSRNIPIGVVI
jgi:hypothetical protein